MIFISSFHFFFVFLMNIEHPCNHYILLQLLQLTQIFSLSLYYALPVPPDILDYPTSTDMVVREGSNVTLKCAATGSPPPTITWRREGGDLITLASGLDGKKILIYKYTLCTDIYTDTLIKI